MTVAGHRGESVLREGVGAVDGCWQGGWEPSGQRVRQQHHAGAEVAGGWGRRGSQGAVRVGGWWNARSDPRHALVGSSGWHGSTDRSTLHAAPGLGGWDGTQAGEVGGRAHAV